MMANAKRMRNVVLAGVMAAALTTLCGCDLASLGGLTSALGGLSDLGSGWHYPATSLYDPTSTIQSVNDYRQEVYDNANAAWDEYIRE